MNRNDIQNLSEAYKPDPNMIAAGLGKGSDVDKTFQQQWRPDGGSVTGKIDDTQVDVDWDLMIDDLLNIHDIDELTTFIHILNKSTGSRATMNLLAVLGNREQSDPRVVELYTRLEQMVNRATGKYD